MRLSVRAGVRANDEKGCDVQNLAGHLPLSPFGGVEIPAAGYSGFVLVPCSGIRLWNLLVSAHERGHAPNRLLGCAVTNVIE